MAFQFSNSLKKSDFKTMSIKTSRSTQGHLVYYSIVIAWKSLRALHESTSSGSKKFIGIPI